METLVGSADLEALAVLAVLAETAVQFIIK